MLPDLSFPLPVSPDLPPPGAPSHSAPSAPAPGVDLDLETLDPEYFKTPPLCFLPDKTPLKLTYSRKELFLTAFPADWTGPSTPAAAGFLLFLASHPRTVWNAPVPDPEDRGYLLAPLHSRPDAFRDFVDGWKDRALASLHPLAVRTLAANLWTGQHENQPILPDDSGVSEKKNLPSPPAGKPATSSPEETPPAPSGSITIAPSGSCTPSSTATYSDGECIPPPPPHIMPSSNLPAS